MNENLLAMKNKDGREGNSCPEKFSTLMDWCFLHFQQETELNLLQGKSTEYWLLGKWGFLKKCTSIWRVGDRNGNMRSFLIFGDGQLHQDLFFVSHKCLFNIRTKKAVCLAERGLRNESDRGLVHGIQSKGERCAQPATKCWASWGLSAVLKTRNNEEWVRGPEAWVLIRVIVRRGRALHFLSS